MASIESYPTASVFMEASLWMNTWGTVLCFSHTACLSPKAELTCGRCEYAWWALIKRVDPAINKIQNEIPSILNPEHIRGGKNPWTE